MHTTIEREFVLADIQEFIADNGLDLPVPNSVLHALVSLPKSLHGFSRTKRKPKLIEYVGEIGISGNCYRMMISLAIIDGEILPEIIERNRHLRYDNNPAVIYIHQVPIDLMETLTATHSKNIVEFLRRFSIEEVVAIVAGVVGNKNVKEHWRNNQKIYGIKEIRILFGCGLLEAKIAYEAAEIFWNK